MFVTELEGGTLTSSAGGLVSLLVRLVVSFGVRWVGNAGGVGWLVVGTLLGPEGTGRPALLRWCAASVVCRFGGVPLRWWVGCCLWWGLMLVVPLSWCPSGLVWGLAVGDVG